MEFLPPEEYEEIYFDIQNVYIEQPQSYQHKISLSMIKEEENVITVIIPHSQNDSQREPVTKRINTRTNAIMNIM